MMNVTHNLDIARALYLTLRDDLARLAKEAKEKPSVALETDLAHVCATLRGEIKYLNTSLAQEPADIDRIINDRVLAHLREIAKKTTEA